MRYCADLRLAGDVVAALTSVERELEEVMTDLRWRVDHLHGTWTGQSASAHLVAHHDWAQAYADMHAALVRMRRVLDRTSQRYSTAAEANVELWKAVR